MRNQGQPKKQSSQYDKVMKENMEVTLPVIIKDVLGLDIVISEELPDDVQHTKERKPDALKKVTDSDGKIYVLQVEFQVEDEKEMVYRMAEYSIMLMRKYQLPIQQYVIFLRDSMPLMSTFLATENLRFNFTLIRISEANYKLFLKSNNPEVQMLGILANFGKDSNYKAIKSIIDSVQSITAKGDFAKSRYFKQMRIIVQLRRSIDQEFEKAMERVSTFFKEENDFLYRRGEAKGMIKGQAQGMIKGQAQGIIKGQAKGMIKGETQGIIKGEKMKAHSFIVNLIVKSEMKNEQIAELVEVDIAFVETVRAGIDKE